MAKFDYLNNYLNSNMNKFNSGGYLTRYDVGGTHEQNPNGGIPLGPDASVEQGETSVDVTPQGAPSKQPTGSKYIFSDRQVWTPDEIKAAGLPSAGKEPMTAAAYTTKLFNKAKGREGDLAAKETLKTFTQRAQQLAETKKQEEEMAINQAMLANSQQAAPVEEGVPPGMEEYAEQPPQVPQQAPMQAGPMDQAMAAQGGYFTRRKYANGGPLEDEQYSSNISGQPLDMYGNIIPGAPYDEGSPDEPRSRNYGPEVSAYMKSTEDSVKSGADTAGKLTDAAGKGTGTGPGAGAYVGAATTGYDLFQTAKEGNTSRDAGKAIATGALQGAAAGAMFGPWGAAIGGAVGGAAGFVGSKKAEKNYRSQIATAGDQANAGMPNAAAWSGMPAARGGYIGRQGVVNIRPMNKQYRGGGKMCATGGFINNYSGGGIYIKPENRGKFTASAERAGEGVQEHAHNVVNNPNATELQRKRAQFAINAESWNANGGYLANGGPYRPWNDTRMGNEGLPLSAMDQGAYSSIDSGPGGQQAGWKLRDPNLINMFGPREDFEKYKNVGAAWDRYEHAGARMPGYNEVQTDVIRPDLPMAANLMNSQGYQQTTGYKPTPAGPYDPMDAANPANAVYGNETNPAYNVQTGLGLKPGPWGPKSKAALLKYQKEKGLTQDSAYGPEVFRAMGLTPKGGRQYIQPITGTTAPATNREITASPIPARAPMADMDALRKQVAADKFKGAKDKFGNFVDANASDLMRAYPILSNIQQRGALNAPTGTHYARLNDAYDVPVPDEARYMRDINAAYANRSRAIGQMGGSQAQQRAAQLGLDIQQGEAVSKTQQGMAELGMNRAAQEQQFRSQIAQYNAQAGDREIETYAQDLGNYETQKSKLTGQIGTDIGLVGKEQTNMKQVAAMYGYDWNGKYMIDKKTGKPATLEEIAKVRQASAATTATTPATTAVVAMGGYLTRRKARY